MSYSRRLIHRCNLFRPTTSQDDTGAPKATMPGSPTAADVPCLLVPADAKRVAQMFGADIQCDAFVLFAGGADVRPSAHRSDGLNDKLVVTDEMGRSSSWMVLASRDAGAARRQIIAAVRKVVDA